MEASKVQSSPVCPWSPPRGTELTLNAVADLRSFPSLVPPCGTSNNLCSPALARDSQSLPSRTLTQNNNQSLKGLGSA